jgi:ribosomal protein S18 acetylase RimI-like enzyme
MGAIQVGPSGLIIREALPCDAELVAAFIIELATHERLLDETCPSIEALKRDLHPAANPRAHCLIAEIVGTPVGMAAYFLSYSTNRTCWNLHLQDFFVREPYRERGVGEYLLKYVGRIAVQNGYESIELEVLTWNNVARSFYERLGMVVIREAVSMYIEGEALKRLAE